MKYIFIASLIVALSLSALLTSPVSAVEPSGASAPVQTAINTVLPTLEQLEQGQLSEEMSEERQKELWDLAHEQLGGAADLAIALADQNPSLSALQDILVVQALAEQMGFSDLSSRLLKAARKTLDKLGMTK